MKAITSGIGLAKMLDVDKMFERQSAAQQKNIEILEDKIDVSSGKKAAAVKLQGLVNGLRSSINKVTSPFLSAFNDKKVTNFATTDTGLGSDYVNVTAGQFAPLGDFSVTVNQKAVAAEVLLQGIVHPGLNTAAPGLDGTLTLNVGGQARNIVVTNAMGVNDIVQKINDTFTTNGDSFRAKLFDNGNGTSNIEISANNTGAGNITFNYVDSGLGTESINPTAANTVAGTNAQITVNGIALPAQASNIFIDIPYKGITIEALKVNTATVNPAPANKQTISIGQDNSSASIALGNLRDSYNHLALFVAQQSQQTGKFDQYADPYKDQGNIYAEGADLHDELILREAKDLLETIVNLRPSASGATLKFNSVADIGLGLVSTPVTEDNIMVDLLTLQDENLYQNAMTNNLDDVRCLFMNNGIVKSNPLNNGASLSVTTAGKQLDSSVLGVDVPIALTFDGTGAITGMTATVGGVDVLAGLNADGTAHYNVDATNKIITFSGTPFDGLRLAYNPKTAVAGTPENFTLNFTHGVADLALYKVESMVSENGKDGSVLSAIEVMGRAVTSAEEEKAKIQETIDNMKTEIERQFDSIAVMELLAGLQIDAIQRILTPAAAA
jgi:hypothetical protein